MPDPRHTALGPRALGLFGRRIRFIRRYPPVLAAHLPLLRELSLVLLALWFWSRSGVAARRAGGVSLPAQLVDLLRFGLRRRIDPISYYLFELYLPQRRAEAAEYLTRYHTKNGLFAAVNRMSPSPYPLRTELTDKLHFAAWCEHLGIRSPRVLLAFGGDAATATGTSDPGDLDNDLFVKSRHGSGARGTRLYRRIGPLRYLAPDGALLSLAQLVAALRTLGAKQALIVQRRLQNHPSLADLAGQSLIVVRVMTCLDARGQPRITDAMLRVLAKLEPHWRRGQDDEWVAAVDIDSGKLGQLTGDVPETCTAWHDTHPITGAAVSGRMLPHWPAVCALARAAHHGFRDRTVVGWDIAITADGPLIVEGNPNPDVLLIQRVHRAPLGRRLLGALLHEHFDRLEVAVPAAHEPPPMPARRLQTAALLAGLLMVAAVHLHMLPAAGYGPLDQSHARTGRVEPTIPDQGFEREPDTARIIGAVLRSLQSPLPGAPQGDGILFPGDISIGEAVAAAERYTAATAVEAELREDDPTHYEVELVNAGGLLVATVDRHGGEVLSVVY